MCFRFKLILSDKFLLVGESVSLYIWLVRGKNYFSQKMISQTQTPKYHPKIPKKCCTRFLCHAVFLLRHQGPQHTAKKKKTNTITQQKPTRKHGHTFFPLLKQGRLVVVYRSLGALNPAGVLSNDRRPCRCWRVAKLRLDGARWRKATRRPSTNNNKKNRCNNKRCGRVG